MPQNRVHDIAVDNQRDDPHPSLIEKYPTWRCGAEHMALGSDEVIDGPQSVVYDEAENRLHVQKALMALTM